MKTFKAFIFNLILTVFLFSCSSPGGNKNTFVLLKTSLGDITLRLYDETPVHRNNFIRLVNKGIFDDVTFHRVIKDFMIQGGDPETKKDYNRGSYDSLILQTVPAEFNKALFHKRGALAAARQGNDVNPEMRSSATQFYIVQGLPLTDEELDLSEQKINNNLRQALFIHLIKELSDSNKISTVKLSDAEIQEKATIRMFDSLAVRGEYMISPDQRNVYKTSGGVPRLDATYTVFGEVVTGMDVVDKISGLKTDENDKPLSDVRILKAKIIRK
jgi:cyclophilin family peptidyl-prolyl cis-trans isomerase